MTDDSEEDIPVLSGSALAALQDFYTARDKESDAFEQLRYNKQENLSISMFKEDWNASQFWFTDSTAAFLARRLLEGITSEDSVAIVSAPSVFIQLKNLLSAGEYPTPRRVCLLEYDERFQLADGFVKFDFNRLADLPPELERSFDLILCDPPYHSEECVTKYAEATNWLWAGQGTGRKRVICTGDNMADAVIRDFVGLTETLFRPEHTARLDNEYACFADFEIPSSCIPPG